VGGVCKEKVAKWWQVEAAVEVGVKAMEMTTIAGGGGGEGGGEGKCQWLRQGK
jgi:hypothetical protein